MSKIENLEINLNVEGWEVSGGRSNNVWGQVPTKNLPFDEINAAIRQGRHSSIWTCYDNVIYAKDKNGQMREVTEAELPKTISATFKPSFNKMSALCENLGMKIAVALDMPTSYNYVVKFDPEEFSKVLKNFRETNLEKRIQPYGIVSIDFLQDMELPTPKTTEKRVKTENGFEWIETQVGHSGEKLISFEESINRARVNKDLSGTNFMLKNWIRGLRHVAELVAEEFSNNDLEKQLKKIESRIVRSFLLREFLGDCDFTSLNSGFVLNEDLKTIRYAPNFDYGECFNKLVRTKIDYFPEKSEFENLQKYSPKLALKMVEKKYREKDIPTAILAKEFSNDTSEENIKFVAQNFPAECKEFLTNLQNAEKNKTFDKIIDSYTIQSCDTPLLTANEADIFKEYLHARVVWIEKTINDGKNYGKNA